jgi:hypothetical protein
MECRDWGLQTLRSSANDSHDTASAWYAVIHRIGENRFCPSHAADWVSNSPNRPVRMFRDHHHHLCTIQMQVDTATAAIESCVRACERRDVTRRAPFRGPTNNATTSPVVR